MAFKRVIYDTSELEAGDKVTVTWSDGNGPHVYEVKEDGLGQLRLVPGWDFMPVYVGDPPLTRVLLHPRKEK